MLEWVSWSSSGRSYGGRELTKKVEDERDEDGHDDFAPGIGCCGAATAHRAGQLLEKVVDKLQDGVGLSSRPFRCVAAVAVS
jgi:hypothetical protein